MELETAIRHQIPIVIIVANNQGNSGSHRQTQFYGADYPERVTMSVPDAHYEAFALAFGGFGAEVHTALELKTALQVAIAADVPACINVHLDPDSPLPV
jgi:thiamine pyrophosphate-dependent acetolactate synthase large subunit-like protein